MRDLMECIKEDDQIDMFPGSKQQQNTPVDHQTMGTHGDQEYKDQQRTKMYSKRKEEFKKTIEKEYPTGSSIVFKPWGVWPFWNNHGDKASKHFPESNQVEATMMGISVGGLSYAALRNDIGDVDVKVKLATPIKVRRKGKTEVISDLEIRASKLR